MSLVYLRAQSRSMLLLKEGPQSDEPLSTGQCPSAAPSPRRIRRVVALDRLQTIANTADRTVSIWPAAAASRQWRRASHICPHDPHL